nr:ABC transporter ATP-binding protein [uncultured Caproiciproducens sp.]
MSVILEVDHATKKFSGLVANEDVSFRVSEGEIIGIVGPNGAGKTTLFNSISGAHHLTSGKIIYNKIDITNKKAHEICKLGIGRTFQIPQSLSQMSVYENVLVAALCRENNIEAAGENAKTIIALCGLEEFTQMSADSLNVMQKKRLEIARALATQPKLLLLDEVMAGLTGAERKDAINLIYLIHSSSITILMIEHVMEVVMKVSNRVIVLNSGKLLGDGTPEEITSNEQVISAYLGGAPVTDKGEKGLINDDAGSETPKSWV